MGTLRNQSVNPRLTQLLVSLRSFQDRPLILVDVGARKGFEKHWHHFGNQINKIGFEPHPGSFDECVTLKSSENSAYYPFALDKSVGHRNLFVCRYPSASSFLETDMQVVERLGMKDNFVVEEEIEVTTIDLDSFCKKYDVGYVDFVKIDAEGVEIDILHGAKRTLSKHVIGISIEVGFVQYRKGQSQFLEIDEYLRQLGFDLFDLDFIRIPRVNSTIDFPRLGELGQLFVGQALYLRDAVKEMGLSNHSGPTWTDNNLLKLATLFELFKLSDCALELVEKSVSDGIISKTNGEMYQRLLIPGKQSIAKRLTQRFLTH